MNSSFFLNAHYAHLFKKTQQKSTESRKLKLKSLTKSTHKATKEAYWSYRIHNHRKREKFEKKNGLSLNTGKLLQLIEN